MNGINKRPAFAKTAEILGYVAGGFGVLGALSTSDSTTGFLLLLCGGMIATAIFMRKGVNWARITFTALTGLFSMLLLIGMGDDGVSDEEAGGAFLVFAIAVCAIVFSWLPSVNAWFSSMRGNTKPLTCSGTLGG